MVFHVVNAVFAVLPQTQRVGKIVHAHIGMGWKQYRKTPQSDGKTALIKSRKGPLGTPGEIENLSNLLLAEKCRIRDISGGNSG